MSKKQVALAAILATTLWGTGRAELKVEHEKENVVASRIEGKWTVDEDLSIRLGLNRPGDIGFTVEQKVVEKIPAKYEDFLGEKTIYLAGTMTRKDESVPFVLIEHNGNPHIVWFRERDGDPLGDAESFNVMLVVAKDEANDLLFIGGDFNNQPFTAFRRVQMTNE